MSDNDSNSDSLMDEVDIDLSAHNKSFEITLQVNTNSSTPKKSSKKYALSQAERLVRIESHKLHTLSLMKSAMIRNMWINDELLHARLLSMTPLDLQSSFSKIRKKLLPDQSIRGRKFQKSMEALTKWWHDTFEILDKGHIQNRTFKEVQKQRVADELRNQGEILRSPKSLMKHAIAFQGSRDTSAILFTALCRALSIPARLVVSLQSVPWQATAEQGTNSTGADLKGKGRAQPSDIDEESAESDMEEIGIPELEGVQDDAMSTTSIPISEEVVTPPSNANPSSSANPPLRRVVRRSWRRGMKTQLRNRPPLTGWPPTIWTEVFSRPDSRWLPIDPVRQYVNKRRLMEPPPNDYNNRLTYVIALEDDGYARDVTKRYAKDFRTKTLKARVKTRNGKETWFDQVMALVTRPYRLQRDDIEDDEFQATESVGGMPTTVSGFKDHPKFVLERHLKQREVIHPKHEIGKFKSESVYPRSNVISLKTSEHWMRIGRCVKEGCQPLKMVKHRAVTINRRRALEMAQSNGDEPVMQALYAEDQTEIYIPEPVIDGKVPKNDFGNIDLYTPNMLPQGGAHIPQNGAAKVARFLQIDYAEAVTGFEFRKGRAIPMITGIVVAAENEEIVLEAFWETMQNEEEKQRARRRARVIKGWTKLVQGLRIQQRMRDKYGSKQPENGDVEIPVEPGGFMTEADEIVQPFHLPKSMFAAHTPAKSYQNGAGRATHSLQDNNVDKVSVRVNNMPLLMDKDTTKEEWDDMDGNRSMDLSLQSGPRSFKGAPITMQKLAETSINHSPEESDAESDSISTSQVESRFRRGIKRKANRSATSSRKAAATGDSDEADFPPSQTRSHPRRRETSMGGSATPTTTRTLRPRVTKSAQQIRLEKEAEADIKRALAE